MNIKIESIPQKYGNEGNYKEGYIGFTYNSKNIVSRGIAYFTRWARMGDIKVSHALIVKNQDECIEAHMETGVACNPLSRYFEDEHCQIFFRKPKGYTEDIGKQIVAEAEKQIGCQYDLRSIGRMLKNYSLMGYTVNKLTQGKLEILLARPHEGDRQWICSELAAYCLKEQLEYRNKGILSNLTATIDPQELFEDEEVFAPWESNNRRQKSWKKLWRSLYSRFWR